MKYHISKNVKGNFDDVVDRVTSELKTEGFGIITEIDLKEKFREKLNREFRNYKILGACNPALAYDAIQVEDHIGIMLPCNVLIQQHDDGRVEVSAINPLQSIGAVNNPQLSGLADQVNKKLEVAIARL
jgi:uncharacterized protein (DUF302 family)